MGTPFPLLLVIAGPNGAGKSTYIRKMINEGYLDAGCYICPDAIAKENGLDPGSESDMKKAMEMAKMLRYQSLEERKDIVLETVFSHPEKVDFLTEAKEKKYFVSIHFIITTDLSINRKRIEKRVSEGGHPVPFDKIKPRYNRAIENLLKSIEKLVIDELLILDNTRKFTEVARISFSRSLDIKVNYIPIDFTNHFIKKLLQFSIESYFKKE
jgi:predicted ABC-type ATPase